MPAGLAFITHNCGRAKERAAQWAAAAGARVDAR